MSGQPGIPPPTPLYVYPARQPDNQQHNSRAIETLLSLWLSGRSDNPSRLGLRPCRSTLHLGREHSDLRSAARREANIGPSLHIINQMPLECGPSERFSRA